MHGEEKTIGFGLADMREGDERGLVLFWSKQRGYGFFYSGLLLSCKIPLLFIGQNFIIFFSIVWSSSNLTSFSCFALLAHLCTFFPILIFDFLIFIVY